MILLAGEDLRRQWLEVLGEFRGAHIQDSYSIQEKIGTGNHSVVYKGVKKSSSQPCAIKVLENSRSLAAQEAF